MKNIKLRIPRVINGVVRQPAEGAFPVSDEEAEYLIEEEAADLVEDDGETTDDMGGEDGLASMTVIELGLLVTKEGVPLHGVTKKADIIKAIRTHRASAD